MSSEIIQTNSKALSHYQRVSQCFLIEIVVIVCSPGNINIFHPFGLKTHFEMRKCLGKGNFCFYHNHRWCNWGSAALFRAIPSQSSRTDLFSIDKMVNATGYEETWVMNSRKNCTFKLTVVLISLITDTGIFGCQFLIFSDPYKLVIRKS